MFKTNFSERNIIWGAQTIFGGQCPEFSPWQRSCAGAVELARFIPDPMPQLLIQALNVWQRIPVRTNVLFDEAKQNITQESSC